MKKFLKSSTKTVDAVHDIRFSSRYDDIEYSGGSNIEAQMDWLSEKLCHEVEVCSHCIMKLERLLLRYKSDAKAADEDGNLAAQLRYNRAINHIHVLLENLYKDHNPVGEDGHYNGV